MCSVWESHHAWKLKETTKKEVIKAYKTITTESNVAVCFIYISTPHQSSNYHLKLYSTWIHEFYVPNCYPKKKNKKIKQKKSQVTCPSRPL